MHTADSESLNSRSLRFGARKTQREPTFEDMAGITVQSFKEYQTPKHGFQKRIVWLPLKRAKKYGFIDETIDQAKKTPGADKYLGHNEWKSQS